MTMIPNIVRAECYSIKISRGDDETFSFEYEKTYDKENRDHKEAFEHMEQIKTFHETMLSTYGKASVEFSKDNMTVKLKLIAPFEKISNFISMEFLMCGSVGRMTLLDLVSMASAPFVPNAVEQPKHVCNEDNKDMYV